MFESLQELIKAGSVSRVVISVEAKSDVHVCVTIQSILGQQPHDASEEQQRIRKAFSVPFCVEGLAGEVDASIERLVDSYISKTKPLSGRLITNSTIVDTAVENAQPGVDSTDNSCSAAVDRGVSDENHIRKNAVDHNLSAVDVDPDSL